jgi:hypothetical protein
MPVVTPGFIFRGASRVAPGPTLPWVDAPGAGWFCCAEAIAVAPNSEAMTRAETASLVRMGGYSFLK